MPRSPRNGQIQSSAATRRPRDSQGSRRPAERLAFEQCEARLALAIDADIWVDSGRVMTGGFDHVREGTPGAVVPYQQVFAYHLGEDPSQPFRGSDPGFNSAPVLPRSYRLTISIDGGLQYWSGDGQPSFVPVIGGLELNLRNRLANWNQRVGASTASSPALAIQTVPANQQIHRHLDTSIGTGGSGQTFDTNGAAPGVYAFSARLGLDPGATGQLPIDPSLPVYYVVGLGASSAASNAARNYFRDLAIGTASMALAVDDGVSSTDGITTNGRINVGSLNPRATKEFSVNAGSTWSPLAPTGFFVVNAGTYAAGALQVRQTIVDHHGTRATVGSNTAPFIVAAGDTVAPTVTITSSRSTLAAGQTAILSFSLSESVTGFTASDVVVTGGSLSAFTGSGTSYTATFTPLANTVTTGTVAVAAGAFQDAAGNSNPAASLSPTIAIDTSVVVPPIDTVAPTVTIASSRSTLAAGQTATLSFSLSESVTGFTASDIVVAGGSLSDFTGSGTSYTATFTPLANTVTMGTVAVAAGAFQDAAGNSNPAASLSPTIAIDTSVVVPPSDTVAPTVTITSSRSTLSAGQTAIISFTVSEPVTGFTASDVVVTGGSLSGFTGSGTSYTATFTPLANTVTMGTVAVAAGAFQDAAGNSNPAASLSPTIAIDTLVVVPPGDTVAPTVTITSSHSTLAAGQTATLSFSLSESVTGFTASDVVVTGGSLSGFTGAGTSYTATFTPLANTVTIGTVAVAANAFQDAAGNSNSQASLSITVLRPPTAVILSSNSIRENVPAGELVGRLYAVAPSPGKQFSYVLTAGAGDTDNHRFVIDGDELRTTETFDFEKRARLTVRVTVQDSHGLQLHKALPINVTNVLEVPRVEEVILPQARVYRRGERLTWTLVTTEAVTVTGKPFLSIRIGGRSTVAEFVAGSGSSRLVFAHTVTANSGAGQVWFAGAVGVRPRVRIRTSEVRMPLAVPGGNAIVPGVVIQPVSPRRTSRS